MYGLVGVVPLFHFFLVSRYIIGSLEARKRTIPVNDFCGETGEHCAVVFAVYIQLFSVRAEMLDYLSQDMCVKTPSVLDFLGVEDSMLHFDSFIRQFVCFDNTCQTDVSKKFADMLGEPKA